MQTEWRLLDSGPCSASFNMALDEAIAVFVRRKESVPTLRLYSWDQISVSLGCFQKTSDLNISYCKDNNLPVVRRPTGGRAILHADELTYSFSVRTDSAPFNKGLMESYHAISRALLAALRNIGIEAEVKNMRERGRVLTGSPLCFRSSSYGELLNADRKIVGSAQRRWKDALLQQGSIPYSFDREKMQRVFGTDVSSQAIPCMAALREIMQDISEDEFKKSVVKAFETNFGVSLRASHPSREEFLLAREIEQQKYLQDLWNLRL